MLPLAHGVHCMHAKICAYNQNGDAVRLQSVTMQSSAVQYTQPVLQLRLPGTVLLATKLVVCKANS